MNLLQIETELKSTAEEILAMRDDLKKKEEPLLTRIKDLKRLKEMDLTGLDNKRTLEAENILIIRQREALYKDDQWAISEAIKDILNDFNNLKTSYIGTKNYDGWNHQGVNWTEYGYGPRHGSIVFSIGMKESARKVKFMFNDYQKSCCIYLLENLKAGKYKPQKRDCYDLRHRCRGINHGTRQGKAQRNIG